MKWEKKGLIYCPNEIGSWKNSYAMLPTPLLIDNATLRIFLGFCDENNVGRIGFIDVDPNNPSCVFKVSDSPVLDKGMKGAFDDNGVVPICVLRKNNQIFLYYIGFQLGIQVPYFMFCGLAISDDNGRSFYRYSATPILDRKNEELYARCGVNVFFDKTDEKYKMWYIGSYKDGWTMAQGKLKPLYTMKYTESLDGIDWNFNSTECLNYQNIDEHGFGRPYVWRSKSRYKMLYSIRTYSRGYYIGYAESFDGINWERLDNMAGIDCSKYGWDSQNLSYPVIFKYNNKTYMFYNGNGCGKTGVGYAELENE